MILNRTIHKALDIYTPNLSFWLSPASSRQILRLVFFFFGSFFYRVYSPFLTVSTKNSLLLARGLVPHIEL